MQYAAVPVIRRGSAQLPEFMLKEYLSGGQLIPILQSYQVPTIPLSFVYPANRMLKPALREFIDCVLEARH